MHILIGILATVAAIIFYLSRISRGASDIADAANEISNLPRKMRYRKKAGKRGLDLVTNPVEAATVLMISVARLDKLGRVSEAQTQAIRDELVEHAQLEPDYAEDLIINMRSLSQYLTQPESTLFPMIKVLQNNVSKSDAGDLAQMLRTISSVDSPIDDSQENFVRRYEERMGL
jgi:uncharacterized tellurite resistance protein B-like protein